MTSIPEHGQLVEVRRRQWVVANVTRSILTDSFPVISSSSNQHLVTLHSIDEDALGEEAQVVWEIEPGARIIERAGLPDITGQDEYHTFEAFLDAVRWGASTNVDKGYLQAPFRSGVSIEDFQLDPLVRAIDMARANLLIADDVGLGKTIEAGLIIQEFLFRHRARTVFIICPASLQEKWRVEMLEKFGLEFKIVNPDYIKELRRNRGIHANPWTSFPRLITSMDWLKTGDPLRMFKEVIPVNASYPRKFDILVVDEAHNVAPAGSTHYALDSLRTKLIRTISKHFQHHLFLTATPHNGNRQSFSSLLELLDEQRFSRNTDPDKKQLSQVMVRRLKTDLVDKNGKPLYPTRNLKCLEIPYTDDERVIHRTLDAYCQSREQTCQSQGFKGTKFVNSLLRKRLFSSPKGFAATLEKHFTTLTTKVVITKSDSMKERILQKAILKTKEDYADDAKLEAAEDDAIEEATKSSALLTTNERQLLNEMRKWAENNSHRKDSKAEKIIEWIEANLKTEGVWNENRVILFTEYRATQQWLQEILASHGFGGDRLNIIHGGMDQEEREKIKAAFQTKPKDSAVRILLATDAASEGIDLQNYCNSLIHLEIPYNPNVMEQRNGRIDRYGQKQKEVNIWHPVDGGDDSETVGGHKEDIIRALRKLQTMREDMGSVNPVIAPQMASLISGTQNELNTKEAEVRAQEARPYLQVERDIKNRIAKLHDRLWETLEDFHLTPDRICQTVKTGLALAGKPPLKGFELDGAKSGTVFEMPALTGTWARCMEGLRHPYTQKLRPITFDHAVSKNRDDVVLVHLNHRLTQMCLRLMRAEVWAQDDIKKLHRVDVRTVSDSLLDTLGVVIVSRLVIMGGTHQRLHEELTYAGGYLKKGGFSRETGVTKITQWLDQAAPYTADQKLFDNLAYQFAKNEDVIHRSLEARSKDRLKNLENTIKIRKNEEIKNIVSILEELSRTIEQELEKPEERQQSFPGFNEDERIHKLRDIEVLKERLVHIPEEKEEETKLIENRYKDFSSKTFPIAAIFLLPESLAGRGAK